MLKETILTHNRFITLFLALSLCAIIFLTINDYGITGDEPAYCKSGRSYAKWMLNPSMETIDKYWSLNSEHPPLVKILGGVSSGIFHDKLHLLKITDSFRLPILLFVFLLTLALYSFVSKLYGNTTALISTLSFFFLPRIFFHEHLGALDFPVTTMWFLVVYAYWKGTGDQKWIYYSAILLGLALLTKLTAIFLYIPLIIYWILCFNDFKKSKLSKIIPLFIIPPIIFLLLWPWLWKDTIAKIISISGFHLHHYPIPEHYFGRTFMYPPWHYPLIMTIITIPLITLIPFFVGLFKADILKDKTRIFIILNAAVPIFMYSISKVKYDDIRLFMPAFPFICIISGMGVNQILVYMRKLNFERPFLFIFALLFALTVYFSIIKYHPYASSTYYNELIGGIDGASSEGMDTGHWGSANLGIIPWLNEHPESTFWIYFKDISFAAYKKDGLLRDDIKFGTEDDSDYLILTSRLGKFNKRMWEYYKHEKPVFSVKVSKTNLISIYKLEE